jgi:hypothetical protein
MQGVALLPPPNFFVMMRSIITKKLQLDQTLLNLIRHEGYPGLFITPAGISTMADFLSGEFADYDTRFIVWEVKFVYRPRVDDLWCYQYS